MERLTFRDQMVDAYLRCDETCGGEGTMSCNDCPIPCGEMKKAFDRLAYYKDMEEQGRRVVLPCKVGDTVYQKLTLTCQKEIVIVIGLDDEGIYIGTTCGTYRKHHFGKTVFLTREEAEKALAADKNVGSKNGGAN